MPAREQHYLNLIKSVEGRKQGVEDHRMGELKKKALGIDAASIRSVRSDWFQQIETLHSSITEASGVECATCCSARCCPKAKTAGPIDEPVGHVAIMLPFELEYILSKTNIDPEKLQHTQIEFSSDTTLNIGFMTCAVPCPFLTPDNQCGIYEFRPLDCRSFPLIPFFNEDGSIRFYVDEVCPSAITFSPAYAEELKQIWKALLPRLPMSYRSLYNDL